MLTLLQDAEKNGRVALANAIQAAVTAGVLADALVGMNSKQAAEIAVLCYMQSERATIAAEFSGADLRSAVQTDLEMLLALGRASIPITDASQSGPLGSLWPSFPPKWGTGLPNLVQTKQHTYPSFTVTVNPGEASPELIDDLLVSLNSLYRSHGGSGLKVVEVKSDTAGGQDHDQ